MMKKYILFSIIIFFAWWFLGSATAQAANWYVDGAVGSSGNGQSWATAWKALSNITGVSPGDTVYISGGTNSQTYPMSSSWNPIEGTLGNPVIYKIGQDSGHNGTAIFDGTAGAGSFIVNWNGYSNITIDGNYGGAAHITFQNFSNGYDIINTGGSHFTVRYTNAHGFWLGGTSYFTVEYNNIDTFCEGLALGGPNPPNLPIGSNKIGYNTITMEHGNTGENYTWAIGWPYSADIYNNHFLEHYTPGMTGCHHSDVIFAGPASKIRVFNNLVEGLSSNYAFYWEQAGVPTDNIFVYNNVFLPGNYVAIVIGGSTITNSLVANNTCFGVQISYL